MTAPLTLSGCRVLIVEDEYFLADDLRRAIQRAGGAVEGPYASCDQAMLVVRQRGCDLAILDIAAMDGPSYPLAEALQWWDIPFIFVTAFEREGIPERLKQVPVRHKPCEAKDVLADLVAMLRSPCSAQPGNPGAPSGR